MTGKPGKTGRAVADQAAVRASRAWHGLFYRHGCSCGGKDCKGAYRSVAALNRHHAKQAYWQGKNAKTMGRKLGPRDAARREARAARHVKGYLDHRGRLTPMGRARPDVRGGPKGARQRLQDAARFDRNHARAVNKEHRAEALAHRGRHVAAQRARDEAARLRDGGRHADRLARIAARAEARGRSDRAAAIRQREGSLRGGRYNLPARGHHLHPSKVVQREAAARAAAKAAGKGAGRAAGRTAPEKGRESRVNGNGTGRSPAGPTPRGGRLAGVSVARPAPAHTNGRTAAPEGRAVSASTGRTR